MAVSADGSLYQAVDGDGGLRQCMRELVERLAADEELVGFYDSVNTSGLAERLTLMFTPLLGGTPTGSLAGLDEAHGRPFSLTADQWLHWSGHLMTVLYLRQLDDDAMQQFALLLSTLGRPSQPGAESPTGSDASSQGRASRRRQCAVPGDA